MATVTVQTEQDPTSAYGNDALQQKQALPSNWGTDDTSVSKGRFRVVIIIVLAVSVLLQFIALTAPGWMVISYDSDSILGGLSVSSGIFYSKTCTKAEDGEVKCSTKSYLDSYRDSLDGASDSAKNRANRDYHIGLGRTQAGASLSWIFTLVSLLLFMCTPNKKVQMIHSIIGCILAVVGIIMGELIFVGLVNISYSNQAEVLTEGMKVGFPYCVFFYILACAEVLASCVMVFKYFHDDVSELNQRLSQQEVVIGTEKRRIDHLRNTMHQERPRSSPRHSPMLRDKHLRPNPRNSPRHSPRSSREIGPNSRASPRPSSREHQTFFPPSPRNSFELRDYDRSSPRPHHDKPSERPRDHDRRDNRPRDYDRRDDRSHDNRDHGDRPRHSGDDRPRSRRGERPNDHYQERPSYRSEDKPHAIKDHMSRDHHEDRYADMHLDVPIIGDANKQLQAIGVDDDNNRKPDAGRGDYQPVSVNSDSETIDNYTTQLDMNQATMNINTFETPREGETDIKDVNTVTIDV